MPKNNLNSWVGKSYNPQFPTYQTAGMLRPATPPPTPATQPPPQPTTPPAPVVVPTVPTQPQDQGGGGLVVPTFPTVPVTPAPPTPSDRDRLIEAIVSAPRFQKTGEV